MAGQHFSFFLDRAYVGVVGGKKNKQRGKHMKQYKNEKKKRQNVPATLEKSLVRRCLSDLRTTL